MRSLEQTFDKSSELIPASPSLPWRMHAPHRIDISPADLLAGLAATIRQPAAANSDVVAGFAQALVTLSVRSALDLYLQARTIPRGSEVIVSAITHPDIAEILRYHGLVPVPVDLDFFSAAPA